MEAPMYDEQPRYNDYPIKASPEEVEALKDKISSSVARSASVLITIVDLNENGPFSREVTFEVGDASGANGFVSFGVIQPQGTEASVRSRRTESGTEYLELIADLTDSVEN